MTLEEQLKDIISQNYKSIRSFTASIQIPYSTLDSILRSGIMKAGVNTVIKVFTPLGLDVESIPSGTLKKKERSPVKQHELSKDETQLVTGYRTLNNEGQEKTLEYLDDLVCSGRYIKNCSIGMGEEEHA